MKEKSISIVIFLLVLLGAFAFVMFSPQAKKDDNVASINEKNLEIKEEPKNMETNTTPKQDPLIVEIKKEGTGDPAVSGDTVTVTYVGTLTNGTEFDKSANHGTGKFTFQVGVGQVIRGWDEGIVGMKVGEVRKLTVSPEYGYGDRAIGSIPANSTLIFEVEMFEIKK